MDARAPLQLSYRVNADTDLAVVFVPQPPATGVSITLGEFGSSYISIEFTDAEAIRRLRQLALDVLTVTEPRTVPIGRLNLAANHG